MRLCGLLLTLTLVLADENDDGICNVCFEDSSEILEKSHGSGINSSLIAIDCYYNANRLSCSWSTDSLADDAQFSASVQFCNTSAKDHPLTCISESSKKLPECQVETTLMDKYLVVIVNISENDYWYTVCQLYDKDTIEKLDPPQNMTTLVTSTNLEIRWTEPRTISGTNKHCFQYELKINNDIIELHEVLAYNRSIEPTMSYIIQIRTKLDVSCSPNEHWSEWSKAMVVGPSGNSYTLKAGVIASIAFVLPMILLAFLLACKYLRFFDMLFPSIPNPSKHVEKLLEKNDFNQVTPTKQIEEGAETVEVVYF